MAESGKKKIGETVKIFIAKHLMPVSVGVFVLFLLAGYLLLFSPELQRIRAANIAKNLETERQAKSLYLASLSTLAEKYADLDPENVADLDIMVPETDDIPALLAMFEAAAISTDVSLTNISFSEGQLDGSVADIKDLSAININLSVSNASYSRFKLFLEKLESNLRLFDIRSLDMNPSSAAYNLSLRAYVRKQAKR